MNIPEWRLLTTIMQIQVDSKIIPDPYIPTGHDIQNCGLEIDYRYM